MKICRLFQTIYLCRLAAVVSTLSMLTNSNVLTILCHSTMLFPSLMMCEGGEDILDIISQLMQVEEWRSTWSPRFEIMFFGFTFS